MAYTSIDDPSTHFQVFTYSGTSNTAASYTFTGNSHMKPDLVWLKQRGYTDNHYLFDSTRGAEQAIYSNLTNAEANHNSSLTSFNTNGFSVGTSNVGSGGGTYVTWNFKANGGTTASNTDGNITSIVQSNVTAGFSIATYTGNGIDNRTIGHGLGVQPSWWIVKRRDSTGDWWFGASSILGGTSNYLKLNSTAANAEINNIWGDSPTSSTLFRVSNNAGLNASGGTYVAYLFANKQGYSKFGKYVGNGNANGPFIYTGFKPAFVMMKNYSVGASWHMVDNKRLDYNPTTKVLYANLNNAEGTEDRVDLLSNGFKLRTTNTEVNGNGYNIIYMAFAENPFVTSTGIPTTAR